MTWLREIRYEKSGEVGTERVFQRLENLVDHQKREARVRGSLKILQRKDNRKNKAPGDGAPGSRAQVVTLVWGRGPTHQSV